MQHILYILLFILLNGLCCCAVMSQSMIFEKDGKYGVCYYNSYNKDTTIQIAPEYDQIYNRGGYYILANKDNQQVEGNIAFTDFKTEFERNLPFHIFIKAKEGWKIGMTYLNSYCHDSAGLAPIVLPPRFVRLESIEGVCVGYLSDYKVEIYTKFQYNHDCTPKHKIIYFDSLEYVYHDLLAIVKKNGKYGVWDFYFDNNKKGRKHKIEASWKLKPQYEAIEAVYQEKGISKYVIFYKIKQGGKWGYIDVNPHIKKHKNQIPIYDELIISDVLEDRQRSIGMLTKLKEKKEVYILYQYYDGKIHFNPEGIEDIRQLGRRDYYDGTNFGRAFYKIKKNGKWGLATWENGESMAIPYQILWMFPCEYDNIEIKNGAELIFTQNNKKGIFKYNFEKSKIDTLLPFQYQDTRPLRDRAYFSDLRFYLIQENDKWGVWLWDSLQVIIEPEYDSIIYSKTTLWSIQKNGKWGLWDYNKKMVVLPPLYDSVSYSGGNTCFILNDGIASTYNLETKESYPIMNSIETLFPLAWKVPIIEKGSYHYLPNLDFFKRADTLAFYFGGRDLNRRFSFPPALVNIGNGQIIQLDKDKQFYFDTIQPWDVYNSQGIKIWRYIDNYHPPGAAKSAFPMLQDFNKDGQLDIFMRYHTDASYDSPRTLYHISVLDGQTGKELWSQSSIARFGKEYLLDVNNDQVLDFCTVGSGGFYVTNGRNGQLLFWDQLFYKEEVFMVGRADSIPSILLLDDNYNKPVIRSWSLSALQKTIATTIPLKTILGAGPKFILVDAGDGTTYFIPLPPNYWTTSKIRVDTFQNTDGTKMPYIRYWTTNEIKVDTITNLIDAELPNRGTSSFIADVLENGQYQYGVLTTENVLGLYDENAKVIGKFMLPAPSAAPVYISDIDQDGLLEILILALDGYLYCYKTNSKGKIWSGGLNCDKPVHQQVISIGN